MEGITHSWIGRINIVKNVHTTQSNLQIQCNPYQKSNGLFHKNRTNNPKVCMESQKPLNSQSKLEEKKKKKKQQS